MRKQQRIATRLATAAAIVGCLVLSLEAQGPAGQGGPPGGPGGPGGRGGGRGGAAAVDPNAPTPKLPSGKPDLSGSWQGGGTITGSGAPGVQVGDMFRRCTPFQ